MFRLFALVTVVLVVGFVWWAFKQLQKEDPPSKEINNNNP